MYSVDSKAPVPPASRQRSDRPGLRRFFYLLKLRDQLGQGNAIADGIAAHTHGRADFIIAS